MSIQLPAAAATTPASPQLNSIFFRLPRELRDQIYHSLCHNIYIQRDFPHVQPHPAASAEPTTAATVFHLRYRHRNPDSNPRLQPDRYHADNNPSWLLTCKTILTEGSTQFARNAEWYSDYYLSYSRATPWTAAISLSTASVTRMELYVENLANYETPYRYEGTDTRAYLASVAQLMRGADVGVKVLRFVGHSYQLHLSDLECGGQATNMVRNLSGLFEGVKVERWEFGIVDRPKEDVWVLYKWNCEEGLRLMVRKRTMRMERKVRPEDDLEKLLPPGWVGKRKPCMCDDCVVERAEGGVGEWRGKM
jgi:hypothetical protein